MNIKHLLYERFCFLRKTNFKKRLFSKIVSLASMAVISPLLSYTSYAQSAGTALVELAVVYTGEVKAQVPYSVNYKVPGAIKVPIMYKLTIGNQV